MRHYLFFPAQNESRRVKIPRRDIILKKHFSEIYDFGLGDGQVVRLNP